MKGENNPRWLGGLKLDKYNYCFTKKLKTEIRERDKYTCQICGKNVIGNAHVHHIDYDKQNNHPHNLITLCVKCHGMTSSGNRDNWFVELAFKQLERDIVWEGI